MTDSTHTNGPIGWMVKNPVAANCLMLFFLLGGLFWGTKIKQEVFPEFTIPEVIIQVVYPGASPEEVEQGIILPVEEAIGTLEGIAEMRSSAVEGMGTVRVEALLDTDVQQLALDIRNEIDRITSFPEEAEEPEVTVPLRRHSVITVVLYGSVDHGVLRATAEMVQDQLLRDPAIQQTEITGSRPLEISIDISQDTLRAYGLTLEDIGTRIRQTSLDFPGGIIKTDGGQIQLRLRERRQLGKDFASIPIRTATDGTSLLLGDIATIRDSFEDTDSWMTYNQQPAIGVEVYRVGDQGPIEVADAVRAHVARLRAVLPDSIQVAAVDDRSEVYKQRLRLLLKNGYLGLLLVFVLLGIFLEPRLAFWVTMGIPVSFLGSLLFLPLFDVSINMVSLFAFIVSLGIVVDDTIIIGENVYRLRQRGYSTLAAAIRGAREMAVPVTFSVLTNIITFMPLYFIPGIMGKIFRAIPVVVVVVFTISLIEALFVLPAHLAHPRSIRWSFANQVARWQQGLSKAISRTINRRFPPLLTMALRYRYVGVAAGMALLMYTAALVGSGRMGMTMFPRVDSDKAYVSVTLPVDVPLEHTKAVLQRLTEGARTVIGQNGGRQLVRGVLSQVEGNRIRIKVYLQPPDLRPISTSDFVKKWRQAAGPLVGLESIQFKSNFGGPGSGAALTVQLQHRDTRALEQAGRELAAALGTYPMVSDIDDGFQTGREQFDIRLRPVAWKLGLTPDLIARQIRAAYWGIEVTRQLRGQNELKIMVRLTEMERGSLHSLEQLILRTPSGAEVPLSEVVSFTPGRGYTEIQRRDGRRTIQVTAEVTPASRADQISAALKADILPGLIQRYPGLAFSFEGKQADRKKSMEALGQGMMAALILVYVLLAVVFGSYVQPAIIMSAIPFGIVGAVAGHLLMGYSLSIVSFFGVVALSGVVVNDALVLIDLTNRKLRQGQTAYTAVINAAVSRFRPIILTTLTTFFGLLPMIFETSRQARFLIPMAISLGFGILFATVITLVLVPSLFLILEDVKKLVRQNS
ncbi:efflux RND transporter permease subunit [Desulfolithobacter sp.]